MGRTTETMHNQSLGVIVCKNCDKEIENFYSEHVVTQYGICTECKDNY